MSDVDKDMLTRELRDRSQDVGGHPIDLASVRSTAGRIRRRRTTVAGAVAALVAAVVVPSGLTLTSGLLTTDEDPGGRQPFAASPSAAPTPDGPVTLDLQGLPRGAAPAKPYFWWPDRQLVTPARRLPMPVDLQSVVPDGDGGWIGLGFDGRGSEVFSLDADLQVLGREQANQRMVVSPDGRFASYVETEEPYAQQLVSRPLRRDEHPDDEPVTWGFDTARPTVEPVGFAGPHRVVFETNDGGKVRVWLADDGAEHTRLTAFRTARDASFDGLVAGTTRANPDGSVCSGVVDAAQSTTDLLWESCDHTLVSFSPDGRHVLAGAPYQSGLGMVDVSVLDARTGDTLVDFTQPRDGRLAIVSTTWEDADSLLAVVLDGTTWSMLRLDVTGTVEEVVDRVEGDPFADFPMTFAQPD